MLLSCVDILLRAVSAGQFCLNHASCALGWSIRPNHAEIHFSKKSLTLVVQVYVYIYVVISIFFIYWYIYIYMCVCYIYVFIVWYRSISRLYCMDVGLCVCLKWVVDMFQVHTYHIYVYIIYMYSSYICTRLFSLLYLSVIYI